MRRSSRILLFAGLSFLVLMVGAAGRAVLAGSPAAPPLPKTRAIEVKDLLFETEIVDPYRWLEDQDSPETRAWIADQNAYTDASLGALPGREKFKQQLQSLIKIDTTNIPAVRNGRYFFFRRMANQDQYVYYMRQGLNGKDEVLLDPHPLSPDHTISIVINAVSHDGTRLVYSLRDGGQDELTPHLFDINARKDLPDKFPKARYTSTAFLHDNSGLYYSRVTDQGPRVFFHQIGSDSAKDVQIFGDGYNATNYIQCALSEEGRYLDITVEFGVNDERSEVYVQDLKQKGSRIVPIVKDLPGAFDGAIINHSLYLRTNWKAPRWRIVEVDLRDPAPDHWREVIPQGDGVLESFSLVGGKMAVQVRQNVVSHLKFFDLNGKLVREVSPPTLGSLSRVYGPWKGHEGFYTFSSFHVPRTVYRYDLASGKQTVWSQAKAPIETDKYEVEQVWYTSKDGTRVPMFLAHQKGLQRDGHAPALLTGYGGFNVSSTPDFSALAAAWMANGGIYAVANLRGGGEFGEEWHRAGMMEKKQNVFDDFIAAAEWLIQNKYTSPERLAIRGGSNGGLLVGAALTQRPDLFAAVICRYPLLDMVRYHKFLVAKYWVSEYGSSEDPQQFKYIYAYSPYHRVKPGTKYPAVLLITGDADTRVAPLHARKMTALLQAATGSDKPVMLRYEVKAGHAGGLPVNIEVDNLAEELEFLAWQVKQ